MTHVPGTLNSIIMHMKVAAQRRRTRRILEGLPEHIRKDIGWFGSGHMTRTYFGR
jgi:hypothetical protein